jgi:hypothetical protein
MYGDMDPLKATVEKLLTLQEFNDPNLKVSLISTSSKNDVTLHFKHVPIGDVMAAGSKHLKEIRTIRATALTCLSQALKLAESLVDNQEVTAISFHTDGFANDPSPSSESRAIQEAVTLLKRHPRVFVNTIGYRDWCDYALLAGVSNQLSGVCIQARDIRQVYEALHKTTTLLAGTLAPAVEIPKGRADTVLFVSRSARKVLGSQDTLTVQGLSPSDDKASYRLYEVSEAEFNSLQVPINGEGASVEPLLAYSRVLISLGRLNDAKYALVSTRHGGLLQAHAKALVSSEVASMAEAVEGALFDGGSFQPTQDYGLQSKGPSVLQVLSVLHQHKDTLEVDIKHLVAGYKRRGIKRIPGVRKEDGTVEVPRVESRFREASDPFIRVNGFEMNRNTATINLLVSQPIDLYPTGGNTRIASVAGVSLEDLRTFNNYTVIGDGSLNIQSLRLRTSDKRTFKALSDLGVVTGAYTPKEPFEVNLSPLPLVDFDQDFVAGDPSTVKDLARLVVLGKILSGLVKGESESLTKEQVEELKRFYLTPSLNFSAPSTNEYANLQEALAKGEVDTRISYKIDIGYPALTSLTKLKSGNEYLKRRFTATVAGKAPEKINLELFLNGATWGIKKLTAATKLDEVDALSYPIYAGFLGLGDPKEIHSTLEMAGVVDPAEFLKVLHSNVDTEKKVELILATLNLVEGKVESIYDGIRPLAFYIGASGIVPDGLRATAMSAEEFSTKYPDAKLSDAEKEEGVFYVLPNGAVITVFVKGEYFSTKAA